MSGSRDTVVLIHPPSVSRRYLATKFPPHGMATLFAGLSRAGLPVLQIDRLMDSLFEDPGGLDVHGRDRDLGEAEFQSFLETGQGSDRLAAFVRRHMEHLPQEGRIHAFSVVSYHQYFGALLLGAALRRCSPESMIILGGPCITVKPATELARFAVPDAWIKGCGLASLLGLWRDTQAQALPGLLRNQRGVLRDTPPSVAAAEDEPLPDFSGLDMDDYRYEHPELGNTVFLPYRTTKGCPSACSFCTGRLVDTYTAKSPEKVATELEALTRRHGLRTVMFTDAAINADPPRFAATCRLLSRDLPDLRWYGYARVRGFTPPQALTAAESGCFALFFGAESAHPPTLRLLGKGFAPAELDTAIQAATQAGIKAVVHLMYNTPHESTQDLNAFLELTARFQGHPLVEFMAQRFLLEPGSAMARRPERFGLRNVRPRTARLFDRQELAYDLADGTTWDAIRDRNARNREILAPTLELLERRTFPRNASGAPVLRELM